MTFYGLVFRLTGWLIGLLLIAGAVTPWADGSVNPASRALGAAIVIGWITALIYDREF